MLEKSEEILLKISKLSIYTKFIEMCNFFVQLVDTGNFEEF